MQEYRRAGSEALYLIVSEPEDPRSSDLTKAMRYVALLAAEVKKPKLFTGNPKCWKAGPDLPAFHPNRANGTPNCFLVVALLVAKPFYLVHFQRAVVFVQSRIDLNMMSLMLSYRFRVLHPIARFVPVIFHYIVVAISSDIATHPRLSDAVRRSLLIVPIALLVLILSAGSCRAKDG
jgi:hypothetical protein